jgi:transcriptional regulator with XRE-family HTH domain
LEYSRVISEEEITRLGKGIAAVLRDQREKKELSKNALAQKAGISVQSVAFIEDAVNSPSVSTLLRICDALGITPEKVFREARKRE